MADRNRAQTVTRALDLLEAMAEFGAGGSTVADLAHRLDLPRTIVRRLVGTLTEREYIRRLPSGRLVLGLRLFSLGRAVADGMQLRQIALPHMRALALSTRETVLLTVLDGLESVCVEHVDADAPLKVTATVGRRLLLTQGASSKVLLIFQPEPLRQELLRQLAARVDTAAVPALISEWEPQGYVASIEELDEGLAGIAAPIRDAAAVIAGVTLVGPKWRFGPDRMPALVASLIETARRISREMGMAVPPGLDVTKRE